MSASAGFGCVLALASTVYAIAGDSTVKNTALRTNQSLTIDDQSNEAASFSLSIGDLEGILAAFFYSSTKVLTLKL